MPSSPVRSRLFWIASAAGWMRKSAARVVRNDFMVIVSWAMIFVALALSAQWQHHRWEVGSAQSRATIIEMKQQLKEMREKLDTLTKGSR